jgi:hypothetical protein
MTPDAFSEQRMPAQPLELDLTRTAVIVVDMVNEFFEPGGTMVLAGAQGRVSLWHADTTFAPLPVLQGHPSGSPLRGPERQSMARDG